MIVFLALLRFILPYLLQNSFYEPHRDEYLYLIEGRHPAWGFMEVPPMMSVLAWITHFLGDGFFWIKFWPSLTGSICFVLTARIAVSLGGKNFSIFLCFLPFVFTGYLRLFFLFHPNFLDVFFWTLLSFSIVRYVQTQKYRWLYLFGISAGLGMMSKYAIAFYVLAFFIAMLLTRQRQVFLKKQFYFALTLALLIFLPNLLWQYNHRFPVVTHMKELQSEQLQFIDPANFLMGQLVMFLPCFFIWLWGLAWSGFKRSAIQYRPLFWAYLAVLLILLVSHGKDYYSAGAYPVLFAFGAYYLETISLRSRFLRIAFVTFPVLLGILIMPIIMATSRPEVLAHYYQSLHVEKTGALRWEDQKNHPLPQDFADMVGWKETALKAGAVYQNIPDSEKSKTMVYCRGYFFAAALNFYRKEAGLPEVYSDDASFLFWMPDHYDVKNLILIAHHIPDRDDSVFQQFRSMTVKDSLSDPLAREQGVKVILYQQANDHVNALIEKSISGKKAVLERQ